MTLDTLWSLAPFVLATAAAIHIAVRVFVRDRRSSREHSRQLTEDRLRNM